MKKSKLSICGFFFIFSFYGLSAAFTYGEITEKIGAEEKKWSFEFHRSNVSDVMKKISTASGVEIFLNKKLNNKITEKSYHGKTIDVIVEDILSEVNHCTLWYYQEEKLVSIGILVLDSASTEANSHEIQSFVEETRGKGQPVLRRGKAIEARGAIDSDTAVVTVGKSSVWKKNQDAFHTPSSMGKERNVLQGETSPTLNIPVARNFPKKEEAATVGKPPPVPPSESKEKQAGKGSEEFRERAPLPPDLKRPLESPPVPPGFY